MLSAIIDFLVGYVVWIFADKLIRVVWRLYRWFALNVPRKFNVNPKSYRLLASSSKGRLLLPGRVSEMAKTIKWKKYGKIGSAIGLLSLGALYYYLPDDVDNPEDLSEQDFENMLSAKLKVDKERLTADIDEIQKIATASVPSNAPHRDSYLAIQEDAKISLMFLEKMFEDKTMFSRDREGTTTATSIAPQGGGRDVGQPPTTSLATQEKSLNGDYNTMFSRSIVTGNFQKFFGPIPGVPLMPVKVTIDVAEEIEDAPILEPEVYAVYAQDLMKARTLEDFTRAYLMVYSFVHQQVIARVKQFNSMMATFEKDKELLSSPSAMAFTLGDSGVNI